MPVKPRIMSKCSVRFGQCVAYFQAPEDAAIYSLPCSEQHRLYGKGGSDNHFALQVSDFAQQFLSELNAKFNLRGPARKNLGTALRVAEVRAAIDKAVLEDAEYVARGADAFRHLSGADMAKSLGKLQRLLVEAPKATGEEHEIETTASESANESMGSSPSAAKEAGEDAAGPQLGQGTDATDLDLDEMDDDKATNHFNDEAGTERNPESNELLIEHQDALNPNSKKERENLSGGGNDDAGSQRPPAPPSTHGDDGNEKAHGDAMIEERADLNAGDDCPACKAREVMRLNMRIIDRMMEKRDTVVNEEQDAKLISAIQERFRIVEHNIQHVAEAKRDATGCCPSCCRGSSDSGHHQPEHADMDCRGEVQGGDLTDDGQCTGSL